MPTNTKTQQNCEEIRKLAIELMNATMQENHDDLKFNLTNQEANQIAHQWEAEQIILSRHGKGILAEVA